MNETTKPIGVAMLSPAWPPRGCANGIVTYVDQISAGFEQLGVRCSILAHKVNGEDDGRSVMNLRVGSRPARLSERMLKRLAQRLNPRQWWDREVSSRIAETFMRLHVEGRADLLEMEESFGWLRLVRSRINAAVVVRTHGPWFLNGSALGIDRSEAFVTRVDAEGEGLAFADGVSCPSASVLAEIRARYQIGLPQAAVIPNPIQRVPREQQWSLANMEKSHPAILFVGRFDRHKGGDLILRAFSALADRGVECRLWFVGPDRGLAGEGGAATSLQQFIEEVVPPCARDRIDVKGVLEPEQIRQLRRRASVVVVPSRYENFPMACLEAMSAGCPIVASRVGGLPEMIQHDRNGLLFEAGNAEDLAVGIQVMLDHPLRAAAMGAQAASDCATKYDPVAVARQTHDFYLGVLDRRRERMRGHAPASRIADPPIIRRSVS